ncbi:MAG: 30S ribosomal protein S12 methylthiotransferase RimO [Bacteroidales bacterium]|nr:30S ribosomal protein S12 methylthiotransferase RimO [Bacteroidales bacterium]
MKTKAARHTVNIITLGCSKNIVDSEVLMGQLRASGVEVVHESDEPSDVVVVNTCGFINDAKEESIDTILRYAEARKAGLVGKVFVMGCLSQRYRKELEAEMLDVDGFYGVNDLPVILRDLGVDYRKELVGERMLTTPAHYAYLKISEGCNKKCSFCAIPLIRGKHVSRPMEELVHEASKLASNGVKELILIAQDLTYYGFDLYRERRLESLLENLAEIDGIEWIRLHYAYPSDFPTGLADVMHRNPKICNYLDIPLQHISDPLLRSMNRGVTKEKTYHLLDTIREKNPGISIRTTLIVGYPYETEEHFEELKKFVKEQRFDRLGVFMYSPEEKTSAFYLRDAVPEEVKKARMEEIMEIQQEISLEKNMGHVGKTMKVIIDRKEGNLYVGRSEFDSPEVDNEILIDSPVSLKNGHFYQVKIDRADYFDLYGTIIKL